MYKMFRFITVILLCLSIISLTACTNKNDKFVLELPVEDAIKIETVKLPQTPLFNRFLDENGRIKLNKLDDVTVSSIKGNYDDRVYIEYNNKPFLYNPVYISYSEIKNCRYIPLNLKDTVLEECFQKAKESGFTTVALYVNWGEFYDGENYNFDVYKIYFDLAQKYDLYITFIWLGYSQNGFMPWQTDREKYPALSLEGLPKNVQVPDLSQQIYIYEACEALEQFCGFVNFFDNNRRTVAIQIEDEINTDYGNGYWLNQFANYAALVEQMANTIKNSKYKMVTTIGISLTDYGETLDSLNGRERIDALYLIEDLDGIGAAHLAPEEPKVSLYDTREKFVYVSKLSPVSYDFFKNALQLLQTGYSFGVFELKSFDININCGLYRTHSKNWEYRDRQTVDVGIFSKKHLIESNTYDIIDFIKSVNSCGEKLTYIRSGDILVLNSLCVNNHNQKYNLVDFGFNFNNSINYYFTFGTAGIVFVDAYNNYYLFVFHEHAEINLLENKLKEISVGTFENGNWIADKETTVDITDNIFLAQSGLIYRIVL